MAKSYQPQAIEQAIYQRWEQSGQFQPSGVGNPYSIVIPPPNVTGSLHMGHGFQHVLMDTLIRYHRMLGDNTLWQVGTDHAGISTQMVVENRLLQQENLRRHDLGREAFVERIWQWKTESGGNITQQMRRLGTSIDWQRECFTLDDDFYAAVQQIFITLYDEGLIYRGKRLVNWDPHFKTAISDLEVNSVEEEGYLWHMRYPLADGSGHLTVATTRPETLLGDTAVAIHPDDERYRHLVGQQIKLPLSGREVPIIADDYVDPEFGSGCVKITPAHDFNDYAMGKRHDLEMINIFTAAAYLNDNVPEKYRGLERFAARKMVVADLESADLLEKVVPHRLKIPRNDRGNHIVEPWLTDQWFVNMAPLAAPAIKAVEQGDMRFVPENWNKTYFQWLENIDDWCISRQLWWGHRIPAWYDDQGNHYVGESELAVREKYLLSSDLPLRQDEDVLDTWFSSSLWPFVTLGWPQDQQTFNTFYPTSVLVTGFDIIFFWVARMMMMGLKFTGQVPFKEVYITGLIRDHEGHKMSKTKGNVLDPIDLIDGIDCETLVAKRTNGLIQQSSKQRIEKATHAQFPDGISASGTDALRFTYCALASTGRDIRFDTQRLIGYRNFCNKLWNAARYLLMNVKKADIVTEHSQLELNPIDRWINSALQQVIDKSHHYFANYRFDLLAQQLHDFVWHHFCDWYLELAKVVLQSADTSPTQRSATATTLVTVLETLLRLLHPLIPFITEEIWHSVAPLLDCSGDTIMLQPYPQKAPTLIDEAAEADVAWLKTVISAIRNVRSEMDISPAKRLHLFVDKGSDQDRARIDSWQPFILTLARLDSISWGQPDSAATTALAGELELLLPLADLIDKSEAIAKLQREIDKQQKQLVSLEKRLNNPNFTAKAPAAVVAKVQSEQLALQTAMTKLQSKLAEVEKL
ncbi:MAG: valine--tRNA ligase [Gammaproteobacteria bacterium]|nr:valine--tRNA ligase [Gammaproteobacteria bacterium]